MSDKPKLKDRLKQSGIAAFLRDKVKPIAGDVLEVVGDITGVDAIERVGELLNKRKEENEEVKALAAEFEMKKLEWQMEVERMRVEHYMEEMRLEVQDRTNARSREIEFMQASGGKRDWLMGVVVITGLLMTVGVISCLVFVRIPEENQRLADMCFGAVLSIGTSIFAYYVGSSRGSARKDATINRMNEANKDQ